MVRERGHGGFIIVRCGWVEKLVRKKRKSRYPFAFPGIISDCYFPGSNIPRPMFKDVREHPQYFGIKKKRPRYLMKKGWRRRGGRR